MWKQITKEQIKDYPVGTKVRIGGRQETSIKSHYSEGDFAFNTEDALFFWDVDIVPFPRVFGAIQGWSNYKVEVWEEEPLTSLEGIYVDTTGLDEDTCKRLVEAFVSRGYKDSTAFWNRRVNYANLQIDPEDLDVCFFSYGHGKREVTPEQVFNFAGKGSQKVSEDNNVEKLNDLINKYFAKNTTLSLAEFLDSRGVKA